MRISAIALAGGKSSRMGRDKALLEINGETLLCRICRISLEVADSVYVVARSRSQYETAIANFPSVANRFMVVDQELDGALVGFWQGIEAISNSTDWILLFACDLPNIESEVLQIWASHLGNLPDQAIAYLPRYVDNNASGNSRKQWEPLCGFYRWSCRDSLTEFINQGGRSFQTWLETLTVVEIVNVPVALLFNCNTPEDFGVIGKRD